MGFAERRVSCIPAKDFRSTGVERHRFAPLCASTSRQLWRLLLRRAQEILRRNGGDAQNKAQGVPTAGLLERGMIPLPLLDNVMGFDADEALRVRRQLLLQQAVSTVFI